jgi:hypothetical protein
MQLHLGFGSRCTALLAVVALSPVHAAIWNYGTEVGLSADWNDNPALIDDNLDPDSTFRFLAVYDGEFERRDDNTILELSPRFTTDYYTDRTFSDLETTEYFLPGSFSYQQPTTVWSLGFNASQQSVLSSEESTSQGVTSDFLQSDDTLTQFSLSPGVNWRLSERDELLFNLSYSLNDYNLDFTNRTDSTTVGVNTSYRRSLNERHTVGITGFANSTDADRKARIRVPPTFEFEEGKLDIDSSSNFITADYTYAVNETSSLRMSYGLQEATTETITRINSTGATSSTGELTFSSTTYNIGYVREGPRSTYSITAVRSVTLDITTGQPQDRDQITFDGDYKFTERLSGGWELTTWQQEPLALVVLDENNQETRISSKPKYADAEVRLSYNITRKWFLTGRYEYRWRSNDQQFRIPDPDGNIITLDQDLKATSSNITIGITYLWKELPR